MSKITVTFEVDETVTFEQLHEALCKTIHEGDEDARQWLEDNILDVESNLD